MKDPDPGKTRAIQSRMNKGRPLTPAMHAWLLDVGARPCHRCAKRAAVVRWTSRVGSFDYCGECAEYLEGVTNYSKGKE